MVRARLPILPREPGAPRTRSECPVERPCPWVGCRYHLLLEIDSRGRVQQNRPFDEYDADSIARALHRMGDTCALDVTIQGELTQEEVGCIIGIDDSQVARIEGEALAKLRSFRRGE